jgi:hypothetical protein
VRPPFLEVTNPSQPDAFSNRAKLKPGESVVLEPAKRLLRAIALRERPIRAETVARVQQAIRLLRQLFTYAASAGPDLPRRELEAGMVALTKFQSWEDAEKAFLSAGEHRRGRPVKRRHVAAIALEEKQRSPRLKRIELAQKFCPCDKAHHNAKCAERLRRDIQRLKALIRRILRDYPA